MKSLKAVLTLTAIALAATTSSPAFAWHHGGHARFGVYIGAPGYWYPPYYYPPYYPAYAYPPVVITPPAPQVYIEQGAAPEIAPPQSSAQSQSPSPSNWWYYCADTKAYYPYVKECPAGWQRVAPLPQQ